LRDAGGDEENEALNLLQIRRHADLTAEGGTTWKIAWRLIRTYAAASR
jgi:hypothetical protein